MDDREARRAAQLRSNDAPSPLGRVPTPSSAVPLPPPPSLALASQGSQAVPASDEGNGWHEARVALRESEYRGWRSATSFQPSREEPHRPTRLVLSSDRDASTLHLGQLATALPSPGSLPLARPLQEVPPSFSFDPWAPLPPFPPPQASEAAAPSRPPGPAPLAFPSHPTPGPPRPKTFPPQQTRPHHPVPPTLPLRNSAPEFVAAAAAPGTAGSGVGAGSIPPGSSASSRRDFSRPSPVYSTSSTAYSQSTGPPSSSSSLWPASEPSSSRFSDPRRGNSFDSRSPNLSSWPPPVRQPDLGGYRDDQWRSMNSGRSSSTSLDRSPVPSFPSSIPSPARFSTPSPHSSSSFPYIPPPPHLPPSSHISSTSSIPPPPSTPASRLSSSLGSTSSARLRSGLPDRQGHALWCGNIPSDASEEEILGFFLRGRPLAGEGEGGSSLIAHRGTGVESVHLIARSNCAFVNYTSEAHLQHAITIFNGVPLRPLDRRCKPLVCRLRMREDDAKSGVGAQRGAGLHKAYVAEKEARSLEMKREMGLGVEEQTGTVEGEEVEGGSSEGSSSSGLFMKHFPRRYFILKAHSLESLHTSVKEGLWSTQGHNEAVLDQAYRTASEGCYIIFSANKSGEWFGYARMAGPIIDNSPEAERAAGLPATSYFPSPELIAPPPFPISPPATFVEREERPTPPRTDSGGRPFPIEWLCTTPLPFSKTRNIFNSFNSNREVKISRDGTEVEPVAGQTLLDELTTSHSSTNVAGVNSSSVVPTASTSSSVAPRHQQQPSLYTPIGSQYHHQ